MSCVPSFPPRACWTLLIALATIGSPCEAGTKGDSMSYEDVRSFLSQHTKVIELSDGAGARVAVTPEWQGRVMTSTCDGAAGPSFGFVNRDYIKAGKVDRHMNGLGAEDRFWLCPEGGPYSLWFKPGVKQVMANWYTPPALNEQPWNVEPGAGAASVRMTTRMKFENASAARFDIDVARDVRLLGMKDFQQCFGAAAAAAAAQPGVKMVAYETINQITNRGPAFNKEKGLISIWILGMMNASPKAVVIVPYKSGPEPELGPVVKSDYFGSVPAERLVVLPQVVLFRADGEYRSKIGVSQRRAHNVLGSIDFAAGVLTLVQFSMPQNPEKCDYLNNMWQLPQPHPYVGDVVNAYNDGPSDLGQRIGNFYEIESVSPAKVLNTGESLGHIHRTIHIHADPKTLDALARLTLGVDLESVRKAMP